LRPSALPKPRIGLRALRRALLRSLCRHLGKCAHCAAIPPPPP
jgi:hypothetical protein